jgi:DNA-binding response OmpR family regulator
MTSRLLGGWRIASSARRATGSWRPRRLDGVELAGRVWEQWPDKCILFMSAHAAEVLAEHGLAYLDVPFLAKPFTRDEALAKVREALERRQTSRQESRKQPGAE